MIKDTRQGIRIWDLPTRLFHWTLAAALAFMFFSAKSGGLWLVWHLRCGLLVAALIIFRLCWGLWGSDTARFARFVRPRAVPAYLRGQWDENRHPGHNPLGGLMVVLMLAAVLFQTATGLFAADGNTFINNGYLNGWIGADAGETVRAVHIRFSRLLAALAVLHIAAVLAMVYFGAVANVPVVWDMADLTMGTMALINLIAILLLSPLVFLLLKDYTAKLRMGRDPEFKLSEHPSLKRRIKSDIW